MNQPGMCCASDVATTLDNQDSIRATEHGSEIRQAETEDKRVSVQKFVAHARERLRSGVFRDPAALLWYKRHQLLWWLLLVYSVLATLWCVELRAKRKGLHDMLESTSEDLLRCLVDHELGVLPDEGSTTEGDDGTNRGLKTFKTPCNKSLRKCNYAKMSGNFLSAKLCVKGNSWRGTKIKRIAIGYDEHVGEGCMTSQTGSMAQE
eukprot:scaffold22701_cov123-Cylindrotheca_fusiformis.AAC.24